ncbi:VOC family protein [Saccharothrix deserti]|uniref:VOC family protein n=1 Tax=Saccharothrix deserti TaxID=2593674 RepID=UPI00131D07C3|nr:VOC family protein [Saccharothrix deserti]
MNIKLTHTFLPVHDQEEALVFYRDVLGLEKRNDMPFDAFRWLTVGPADQPEVEIVLEDPAMGRPAQDVEVVKELLAKGSLFGLIFYVDDCDAVFEKVRASGAEVMQEPIDQPYGVRDCGFRDPSGNALRFSGPIKG